MTKWAAGTGSLGSTAFPVPSRDGEVTTDLCGGPGGNDFGPVQPGMDFSLVAHYMGALAALVCEARGIPYEGMRLDAAAALIEGERPMVGLRLTVGISENPSGIGGRALATVGGARQRAGIPGYAAPSDAPDLYGEIASMEDALEALIQMHSLDIEIEGSAAFLPATDYLRSVLRDEPEFPRDETRLAWSR